MRSSVLTMAIFMVLSLAACMSAAEKAERDAKLARVRAEALVRLNQAKQEQAQRMDQGQVEQDPAFIQWQKDNAPYVRSLCTTPLGSEHNDAWENYRIAVSVDEGHAEDARQIGRLIQCLPAEETSGYPWPTRPGATADDKALDAEWRAICAKPPSADRVDELRVLAQLHGLKPLACMPDLQTALSEANKEHVPPTIWAEVKRICREGTNADMAELLKEYDFSEVVCPPEKGLAER